MQTPQPHPPEIFRWACLASKYGSRTLFPQVTADESKTRRHDILQNEAKLLSVQPFNDVQPPMVESYGAVFGFPSISLSLLSPSDSLPQNAVKNSRSNPSPGRRVRNPAQTTPRLDSQTLVCPTGHLAFTTAGTNRNVLRLSESCHWLGRTQMPKLCTVMQKIPSLRSKPRRTCWEWEDKNLTQRFQLTNLTRKLLR